MPGVIAFSSYITLSELLAQARSEEVGREIIDVEDQQARYLDENGISNNSLDER